MNEQEKKQLAEIADGLDGALERDEQARHHRDPVPETDRVASWAVFRLRGMVR